MRKIFSNFNAHAHPLTRRSIIKLPARETVNPTPVKALAAHHTTRRVTFPSPSLCTLREKPAEQDVSLTQSQPLLLLHGEETSTMNEEKLAKKAGCRTTEKEEGNAVAAAAGALRFTLAGFLALLYATRYSSPPRALYGGRLSQPRLCVCLSLSLSLFE